jgi:hypothetical protein
MNRPKNCSAFYKSNINLVKSMSDLYLISVPFLSLDVVMIFHSEIVEDNLIKHVILSQITTRYLLFSGADPIRHFFFANKEFFHFLLLS